jgi:hypothetical protein
MKNFNFNFFKIVLQMFSNGSENFNLRLPKVPVVAIRDFVSYVYQHDLDN